MKAKLEFPEERGVQLKKIILEQNIVHCRWCLLPAVMYRIYFILFLFNLWEYQNDSKVIWYFDGVVKSSSQTEER